MEGRISAEDFWTKEGNRNAVIQELKLLKGLYLPFRDAEAKLAEIEELLTIVEADDAESQKHLDRDLADLDQRLAALEFQRLLGGEADHFSAIVSINAGAGGTESCDWAAMLMRMYKRWADQRGFKIEEADFQPGEGAGIKSATFMVRGPHAFGYLKSENGVHRLVRISPFDANKRRHTSFASVEVIPEIEDDIEITIDPNDLKIDTFRAGGAGGQHVNMTDSAVRITHLPTGTVVQCQNERSQLKNKTSALKMLKSRLYTLELEKREAKQRQHYEAKNKIEWGSQIRSYVLHPYNLVKDHRTDHETSDARGVLEGDLNSFMESYLKMRAEEAGTQSQEKQ